MKTLKPVTGVKEVVVLDVTKKGTEDRFTITFNYQVKGTEREFKDVLFYDANNTARGSVIPAIFRAIARQLNIKDDEWITEEEETLDYNIDKVMQMMIGKEITVKREQVISERNGQVYYNTSYNPIIEEEDIEL